jgi:hypothetical protein
MTTLVVLTVVVIALLIAGLAFYLWVVGSQLNRVAAGLEEANRLVQAIKGNAETIEGNLEHINRTGGVIAGALPLLYGMAEGIVAGATYEPSVAAEPGRVVPVAAGGRRSRLLESVGYAGEE